MLPAAFQRPELHREFSVREIPFFLAKGINLQTAEAIKNTSHAVNYLHAQLSIFQIPTWKRQLNRITAGFNNSYSQYMVIMLSLCDRVGFVLCLSELLGNSSFANVQVLLKLVAPLAALLLSFLNDMMIEGKGF